VSLRLRQEIQSALRRGEGGLEPGSPMPYGDEALIRPRTFLLHERGERPPKHRVGNDSVPPARALAEGENAETGALHKGLRKTVRKEIPKFGLGSWV
jgi:hypothetical protein